MERLSPNLFVTDALKLAATPSSPASSDAAAGPSYGAPLAGKMDSPAAKTPESGGPQASGPARQGPTDGGTKSSDASGTKSTESDTSGSSTDAASADGAKGRADAAGKGDKTAKTDKDGAAAPGTATPDPAIAALVAGHAAAVSGQRAPTAHGPERTATEALPAADGATTRRTDAAAPLVGAQVVGKQPPASVDVARDAALRTDDASAAGLPTRGADVDSFAARLDTAAVAAATGASTQSQTVTAALERTGADPGTKAAAAADAVANASPGTVPTPTLPIQAAATTEVRMALQMDARVGARGFGEELGNKVVWMAGTDHQSAELHLNPPDLGPLQVVLDVNRDQATAFFSSPHAEVRQAVEDALPKLREMLAQSGIQLGSADVGANPRPRQDQDGSAGRPARAGRAAGTQPAALAAVSGAAIRSGSGLVDTFA